MDCSRLQIDEKTTTHHFALTRCDCLKDEYHRRKLENMKKSNRWQVAALILTAITPVLLLLPSDYVDIFAATTSAGAAIATGMLAIHGYRENFIRYGAVWHALQTERYLYLARAGKVYSDSDEEKAARRFANRIEQLVKTEVDAWQAMMEDIEW